MKYRFYVDLSIHGYVDAETDDPVEYAAELEEIGLTARDLTFIDGDEVEVDDWDEVKE